MGQINKNTEETKEKCISEHAQLWKLSTHTPRPRGGGHSFEANSQHK